MSVAGLLHREAPVTAAAAEYVREATWAQAAHEPLADVCEWPRPLAKGPGGGPAPTADPQNPQLTITCCFKLLNSGVVCYIMMNS